MEVKPDHLVLQADEAKPSRLQAMGYEVEQLQMVEQHVSTFAMAAAATGYHTVESLEQDLRRR
jgi:carboxypeptidase T